MGQHMGATQNGVRVTGTCQEGRHDRGTMKRWLLGRKETGGALAGRAGQEGAERGPEGKGGVTPGRRSGSSRVTRARADSRATCGDITRVSGRVWEARA